LSADEEEDIKLDAKEETGNEAPPPSPNPT
jgi:hypothetical protein